MVKKKREKDEHSWDITTFLVEKPARSHKVKVEETLPKGFSELVYNYIASRGGEVAKSELYRWAKERKIPMAGLYKAIQELMSKSKVKRMFSEEKEEIIYRVSS
ncbi:MAG: hypothetical protein DRJ41_04635 [Thermoprotei archaeon]|nr:MAG: hypothetical protein DRJ41_04635 [Thermoprotei archaeon]HDI32216.1 hypothetical protein [Thermofilum sp.]